jgi:hypothetical protein
VHLSGTTPNHVTESGRPLGRSPGVGAVTTADGVVTVAIGAGTYSFSSQST